MKRQDENHSISLNELKIGTMGKILFASIGAWLVGKAVSNISLRGTREQVESVQRAMMASKKFHDELNKPDADLATVSDHLSEKHEAAAEFERVTGVPWLL